MLKKTITYTDYNEVQHTEDFYFNLSRAELALMEMSENGGLTKHIEKIVAAKSNKDIIELFKDIIGKSVGRKSEDGKRFIKNDEVRDEFLQSEAYSELIIELLADDNMAAFINGITGLIEPTSKS